MLIIVFLFYHDKDLRADAEEAAAKLEEKVELNEKSNGKDALVDEQPKPIYKIKEIKEIKITSLPQLFLREQVKTKRHRKINLLKGLRNFFEFDTICNRMKEIYIGSHTKEIYSYINCILRLLCACVEVSRACFFKARLKQCSLRCQSGSLDLPQSKTASHTLESAPLLYRVILGTCQNYSIL